MLSLLDELEGLIGHGIRVPASGRILVDEAAIRQIIERMHEATPDEVRLGQRIASERERILNDARSQARRILEDAQAQMGSRVDDHAIVQAARQKAREIQVESEQRAASLRREANQYVVHQLGNLEARLRTLLHEVQGGQQVLMSDSDGRNEDSGRKS